LNILDSHIHSENFYADFFNLLLNLKFVNLNAESQNIDGIDLLDRSNHIVAQVSSTATQRKINSALSKNLSCYSGYSFMFVAISKDAKKLRGKTYGNPHKLKFSSADDIYDVPAILRLVLNAPVAQQKRIFEFVKKELQSEPSIRKVESNLATVIGILSKENWSVKPPKPKAIPYDIEAKISHNHLITAKKLIDEHKIHYHRIEGIYSDFDKLGVNKSLSVLNGIHTDYVSLCRGADPDTCFFSVINSVMQRIINSVNYSPMPEDELELCVQLLVVDAFIRCKIFENPSRGSSAHP